MAWIGITDHAEAAFDAAGIGPEGASKGARRDFIDADALVPYGSLVIETSLSPQRRPQPLLTFGQSSSGPLQLNLQAIPGGGLTLVVSNGTDLQHCAFSHAETGRTDVVRITYCWDAPARCGRISVERSGQESVSLFPVKAPRPMLLRDLRALILGDGNCRMADDVVYVAVADHLMPVGPAPTLTAETPVATPMGYRMVSELTRGDTVIKPDGEIVPVLHRVDTTYPARGAFSPIRLRAPFFGLQQDISVAPDQCLVVRGSEVEYLFGREAVLAPARHLAGASAASAQRCPGIVRYCQLLLPGHETINLAGSEAESLYIGRLRRKPELLSASLMANLEQAFLPDHGASIYPVLRAYDTQVLADYRAA